MFFHMLTFFYDKNSLLYKTILDTQKEGIFLKRIQTLSQEIFDTSVTHKRHKISFRCSFSINALFDTLVTIASTNIDEI